MKLDKTLYFGYLGIGVSFDLISTSVNFLNIFSKIQELKNTCNKLSDKHHFILFYRMQQ